MTETLHRHRPKPGRRRTPNWVSFPLNPHRERRTTSRRQPRDPATTIQSRIIQSIPRPPTIFRDNRNHPPRSWPRRMCRESPNSRSIRMLKEWRSGVRTFHLTGSGYTPRNSDGAGGLQWLFLIRHGDLITTADAGFTPIMAGTGNPVMRGVILPFIMAAGGGMHGLDGCGIRTWYGHPHGSPSGAGTLTAGGPLSHRSLSTIRVQDFSTMAAVSVPDSASASVQMISFSYRSTISATRISTAI